MSYLPSIKVALLDNINWSNGSRIKPLNPITVDLIAKFEEKKDHKISWINDETGLIVLAGDFNYLVYKETEFYTLTKSRVIDAEKLIFVYTVIKDHWQNFISNPNNYVKGCLIKTNESSVLWSNIQYTKAAVLNANYEQIFLTDTEQKTKTTLSNFLQIIGFKKNQFTSWGIVKSEFEAFKKKLTSDYSNISKKPNQIISYCPLRKIPDWKNYIAKIVENFLTENIHDDPLTLAIKDDITKISQLLNTNLNKLHSGKKRHILYKKLHHFGNERLAGEEQKIIKKIDLSRIDNIELIDTQTLQPISLGNKELTDFYEDSNYKGIKKNNKTWILKNKMYSPVADASHYSYLNVYSKSFKENYTIVNKKLEEANLKSLNPEYKEHNYDFTENNVPAIYYADWSETISDSSLKNIINDNNFSTEMGFLLYKISNFKGTCYKNISNKFIYNGNPIFLTTGIKTPPKLLKCSTVRKLTDNTVVRGEKMALFGDIFRNEINKSVWLTLWSSYLWKGDFDRVFEGLSPDNLQNQFSYTVAQCYIDENGEVFDSIKQSQIEEQKQEKLPTWGVSPFRPLDSLTEFKKALQELTERRNNIEINEQIKHPDLDVGDIYWNDTQHGFFNNSYELIFDNPTIVLYGDTNYSYLNKSRNQTVFSLKDRNTDYGFKYGFLKMWECEDLQTNPNNLISQIKKPPKMGTIDTLLTEYPETGSYDLARFKKAWQKFLSPTHSYDEIGYLLDLDKVKVDEFKFIQSYWPIYFYDNNVNYIDYNNFDWSYNWEQYNNQMDFVTSVELVQPFWTEPYIVLNYENNWKKAYLYGLGQSAWQPPILYSYREIEYPKTTRTRTKWDVLHYINNNLLKKHFLIDTSSYTLNSWGRIQQANQDLTTNLNSLLKEVYQKLASEPLKNNKLTNINEEELKKHVNTPLLFVFKTANKPVFYASISWDDVNSKPKVTIYLADLTMVINEPVNTMKLLDQSSLYNNNITQVINQRNFLYAHGETIELQTKILGSDVHKNFNLRIQNIKIDDTAASHYRVLFESEVEIIKKYIVKPKLETVGDGAIISESELLNYKIQQDYRLKTESFERELNKENERLANQNLRNLQEELFWDKSNYEFQSGLNIAGSLAAGLTTGVMGFKNPALLPMAIAQAGTGIAGSIHTMRQSGQQIAIRTRNLEQADVDNAFKISHAKRAMDERHKNDEAREKLQLYKITNNITSKIPNQADILEAVEKFDGVTQSVCVYNRIPTGKLLEYLIQYHENYGYDITVNNYELTVQNMFKNPNKTIYQFLRVDELSISNLIDYEPIKACFLNGIYLVNFEYKLIHVSYLELQAKHREKIAAAKARVLEAERAQRKKELEEIKAASEGVEKAKKDFQDILKQRDTNREAILEKTKEINKLKAEIESCKNRELGYQANAKTIVKDLINIKEHENCLKELEALKQEKEGFKDKITKLEADISKLKEDENHISIKDELLRLKEQLRREKEACKDKDAQIVQQGRNFVSCQRDKNAAIAAKNTAIRDKNTAIKEKDDINKNYQTLLGEVAADKTELERLKNENEQLKTQEGGEAGEITRIRNLYEELAKKKTRLAQARKIYANAWKTILVNVLFSKEGKGYHNYIRAHVDLDVVNKYNYIYKNNLVWKQDKNSGGILLSQPDAKTSVYLTNDIWIPNNVNNYVSLIPKNSKIEEWDYSTYYFGFKLFKDSVELQFQLYYLVDYFLIWDDKTNMKKFDIDYYAEGEIKREFIKWANRLIKKNKEIWDIKEEIAQHIFDNKEIFKNEDDAVNVALEWEQINY